MRTAFATAVLLVAGVAVAGFADDAVKPDKGEAVARLSVPGMT